MSNINPKQLERHLGVRSAFEQLCHGMGYQMVAGYVSVKTSEQQKTLVQSIDKAQGASVSMPKPSAVTMGWHQTLLERARLKQQQQKAQNLAGSALAMGVQEGLWQQRLCAWCSVERTQLYKVTGTLLVGMLVGALVLSSPKTKQAPAMHAPAAVVSQPAFASAPAGQENNGFSWSKLFGSLNPLMHMNADQIGTLWWQFLKDDSEQQKGVLKKDQTSQLLSIPVPIKPGDSVYDLAARWLSKDPFIALALVVENIPDTAYLDAAGVNVGAGYCIGARLKSHGEQHVRSDLRKAGFASKDIDVLVQEPTSGAVRKQIESVSVSTAQAVRLLMLTKAEYKQSAIKAVGQEHFDSLNAHQRATLTYLSYNTGSLHKFKRLIGAVHQDDHPKVMQEMTPRFKNEQGRWQKNHRLRAWVQAAFTGELFEQALEDPHAFERTFAHAKADKKIVALYEQEQKPKERAVRNERVVSNKKHMQNAPQNDAMDARKSKELKHDTKQRVAQLGVKKTDQDAPKVNRQLYQAQKAVLDSKVLVASAQNTDSNSKLAQPPKAP